MKETHTLQKTTDERELILKNFLCPKCNIVQFSCLSTR